MAGNFLYNYNRTVTSVGPVEAAPLIKSWSRTGWPGAVHEEFSNFILNLRVYWEIRIFLIKMHCFTLKNFISIRWVRPRLLINLYRVLQYMQSYCRHILYTRTCIVHTVDWRYSPALFIIIKIVAMWRYKFSKSY